MAVVTKEEISYAQEVEKTYGVPASITLAQFGLESGWGKYTVGQNNYFNIKGDGDGGYRNYDSKEESFMDFGKLLTWDNYTQHTKDATTVREYIEGVQAGGYAEDTQYVDKIMDIINDFDLTQYDGGTVQEIISNAGGTTGKTTTSESSNGLKWWGDIVRVVFILLIIVGGVVLLGVSITNNSVGSGIVSKTKKAVKEVKKND